LRRRLLGDVRAQELLDDLRDRLYVARVEGETRRLAIRDASARLEGIERVSTERKVEQELERAREELVLCRAAAEGLAWKLGIDVRPRPHLSVIEGDDGGG